MLTDSLTQNDDNPVPTRATQGINPIHLVVIYKLLKANDHWALIWGKTIVNCNLILPPMSPAKLSWGVMNPLITPPEKLGSSICGVAGKKYVSPTCKAPRDMPFLHLSPDRQSVYQRYWRVTLAVPGG